MKVLWAPWRMEYIHSDNRDNLCIFCPGDDRGKDKGRLILFVGSLTLVMMNKYPYVNGHLLVAPIRHLSEMEALSHDEALDLLLMVQRSIRILKKTMNPNGFNVGLNLGHVAGAGIEEHIHFHIVPRWHGDTNYMTVVGDVRVIPEHITETYGKLKPHFDNILNIDNE
jgi:ATP adenylyltransferase